MEQPFAMSKPRLPTHAGDAWECSFLFDAARDVRALSCRGGMVLAGGEEMYLLRPGAQKMASRAPPLDIGPIRAVAAEPRAPWRYAVASEELVAVFYRNNAGDQILRLRCNPPGPAATHLAWGRSGGVSTLYVRWDDGAILRVAPDMSGGEALDFPPMDAIAADQAGVLALVSFDADEPLAYFTRDGEALQFRPLPRDLVVEPDQRVHLAVADEAVAFAIADGGVFVSRAHATPFVLSEPLAKAGPIEFAGASSDAALFGATNGAEGISLLRVDAAGDAVLIAELGADNGPPPALVALGWDASRRVLWGASPQVGIVSCTAPSAKGAKKPLLS